MWDQRYDVDTYVYGVKANDFLRENANVLPKGKVLSLAEGEGRNAVFLAKNGYQVTAVDSSAVGLEKAQKLAKQHGVEIEFIHADLAEFDMGKQQWDGIVAIYCPLSPELRERIYKGICRGLKPGGVYLSEAYTPEQINYGTGGGDNPALMQTAAMLKDGLFGLHFEHLQEKEREVVEGIFHTGLASVVQVIARS